MWPFKKKGEQSHMDELIDYRKKLLQETQDLVDIINELEDQVRELKIENMALNYRKEDLKKSANLYLQRARDDTDKYDKAMKESNAICRFVDSNNLVEQQRQSDIRAMMGVYAPQYNVV